VTRPEQQSAAAQPEFVRVKNFERFQHYKKRNPPWIKLYNSLLEDYEFAQLPDSSKMHLVSIWLLASKYENQIPADSEWIGKRIAATEVVDLEQLIGAGFLLRIEVTASSTLAARLHNHFAEREQEIEAGGREEEQPSVPTEPGVAARLIVNPGAHNHASVMGLVVDELYFGLRPTVGEMKTNGSILKLLHARGWKYDDLANMVLGLSSLRVNGLLKGVGARQPISLKWLNDKDPTVDPCQRALDAFYSRRTDRKSEPGGLAQIGAVLRQQA
jgi:hypothetical protein